MITKISNYTARRQQQQSGVTGQPVIYHNVYDKHYYYQYISHLLILDLTLTDSEVQDQSHANFAYEFLVNVADRVKRKSYICS